LLGADGLHHSRDGIDWEAAGGGGYPVNDIIRESQRCICATAWGLWEVDRDSLRWTQLHDETLTEVLAIAPTAGDPGVVAVSPYGLAFGERREHGAVCWQSCSDDLSLNERFSNAVLAHPENPENWIVGTEDGVLIFSGTDSNWHRTDLTGRPCRALLHVLGCLWAGTDEGGIWRSMDGFSWERAGHGLDSDTVFSLAAAGDRILAGTLRGICVGNGESTWRRLGPSLLVSAVAAHPEPDGPWFAGATPGGLWRSDDAGEHWRQIGSFDTVRVIIPPEATS